MVVAPRRWAPVVRLLLLLAPVSCGELATLPTEPVDTPDPTATFTRVQNEVFTPSCAVAGCHDVIGQQQNLMLTEGTAYAMIVGRRSTEVSSLDRIAPGNPDDSYLYRKITGASISGERMPQGQPPLPDDKIRLVRDWIRRGAPND